MRSVRLSSSEGPQGARPPALDVLDYRRHGNNAKLWNTTETLALSSFTGWPASKPLRPDAARVRSACGEHLAFPAARRTEQCNNLSGIDRNIRRSNHLNPVPIRLRIEFFELACFSTIGSTAVVVVVVALMSARIIAQFRFRESGFRQIRHEQVLLVTIS